jgi:hypothetical protein
MSIQLAYSIIFKIAFIAFILTSIEGIRTGNWFITCEDQKQFHLREKAANEEYVNE